MKRKGDERTKIFPFVKVQIGIEESKEEARTRSVGENGAYAG